MLRGLQISAFSLLSQLHSCLLSLLLAISFNNSPRPLPDTYLSPKEAVTMQRWMPKVFTFISGSKDLLTKQATHWIQINQFSSVQFSLVAQSCLTLCDPMSRSTRGLPVHHQLPEFTQTHVHQVGDATQPSHPLSSPSPPAPNPSQHQSLFQWVNSSHEVAKVLEFQPQHQSFQWSPRTDLL